MRIAILDDYAAVALKLADWRALDGRAEITVLTDHVADEDALAQRLAPFDILCVMRERTPIPRRLIERLPKLKLIASTGPINAAIDVAAAAEHGVEIRHTGYASTPTIEMTWALILAASGICRARSPRCATAVGNRASAATCTAARWACSASATSAARWRASAPLSVCA